MNEVYFTLAEVKTAMQQDSFAETEIDHVLETVLKKRIEERVKRYEMNLRQGMVHFLDHGSPLPYNGK